MVMSIDNIRNRVGRPRINATPVTVRIPPEQLSQLDEWIDTQTAPRPSRPEAIRIIMSIVFADAGETS